MPYSQNSTQKLTDSVVNTEQFMRYPCELAECNGKMHLNGHHQEHFTLAACPKFNNSLAIGNTLKNSVKLHRLNCESLAPQNERDIFEMAYRKTLSDVHSEVITEFSLQHQLREMDLEKSFMNSKKKPAESLTQPYRLRKIQLGDFEISTLYKSDYPTDVSSLPFMFVCEFCLCWFKEKASYMHHRQTCVYHHPPGNEIYRKAPLSVFEIDGSQFAEYCRNLCLLSRLFLKQKTVSSLDQVALFTFYVLTIVDHQGCHMAGYFSKQKYHVQMGDSKLKSPSLGDTFNGAHTSSTIKDPSLINYNNLSCLLILPQHQKHGYGKLLVELSYHLSMIEQRVGTPERPLSDLGISLYRKHWSSYLLAYLKENLSQDTITMMDISSMTGIAAKDIASTLMVLGLLKHSPERYFILKDEELIDTKLDEVSASNNDQLRIHPECLDWTPPSESQST